MDPRSARRAGRSLRTDRDGLSTPEQDIAGGNGNGQQNRIVIDLTTDERSTPEAIHEDDLCPICRLLLMNPVKTTCNHTLCRTCMALWAQTSFEAPMVRVDVDEEPIAFDPVSELEARCPMCRTMTSASEDAPRAEELQEKYPRTWTEREAEDALLQDDELLGGGGAVQTITVYLGNRHKLVRPQVEDGGLPQNQHEWTFFVKPSRTDIIEEVHFFLHPTFRPSTVVRQRLPYELTRIGWGVFAVQATVILKAGYSWVSEQALDTLDGAPGGALPLEWFLDFDGFHGRGSMARLRLKVKNDRDWPAVGEEPQQQQDDRELRRMARQYERDGRYEP